MGSETDAPRIARLGKVVPAAEYAGDDAVLVHARIWPVWGVASGDGGVELVAVRGWLGGGGGSSDGNGNVEAVIHAAVRSIDAMSPGLAGGRCDRDVRAGWRIVGLLDDPHGTGNVHVANAGGCAPVCLRSARPVKGACSGQGAAEVGLPGVDPDIPDRDGVVGDLYGRPRQYAGSPGDRRTSGATIHIPSTLRRSASGFLICGADGAMDEEADTVPGDGDASGGIVALAATWVRMEVAFCGNAASLLGVGRSDSNSRHSGHSRS